MAMRETAAQLDILQREPENELSEKNPLWWVAQSNL